MPKIAIGCVVRNRAWILPEYLAALEAIDHPEKAFLFLENDSTDETQDILLDFADRHPNDSAVVMHDFAIYGDIPGEGRDEYSLEGYSHLAVLRNKFVEVFLRTNYDYLLSIDSDIIVPPDILTRLLQHADQNTIIGAAISNIPRQPLDGSTPGNFMIDSGKRPTIADDVYSFNYIFHPTNYPLSGIMDVDVIGAVYLIPRKALEDGIRYAAHPQGEDIPFCISARQKGISMRVMMDLVCDHRMIKP